MLIVEKFGISTPKVLEDMVWTKTTLRTVGRTDRHTLRKEQYMSSAGEDK